MFHPFAKTVTHHQRLLEKEIRDSQDVYQNNIYKRSFVENIKNQIQSYDDQSLENEVRLTEYMLRSLNKDYL